MIPASEPSLRDRVTDALDTESVSQRIKALVDLLEEYGGEQARIGYRQGRESIKASAEDAIAWTQNETWRAARAHFADELTTRCLDAMRAGDPEKVANGLAQAAAWIRDGEL